MWCRVPIVTILHVGVYSEKLFDAGIWGYRHLSADDLFHGYVRFRSKHFLEGFRIGFFLLFLHHFFVDGREALFAKVELIVATKQV